MLCGACWYALRVRAPTGGEGTTPCVQGKVVLVGEAMSGKTTLLKTLNWSTMDQLAAWALRRNVVPLESCTIGVDVSSMTSLPLGEMRRGEREEERISINSSQVFLIAFDFASKYPTISYPHFLTSSMYLHRPEGVFCITSTLSLCLSTLPHCVQSLSMWSLIRIHSTSMDDWTMDSINPVPRLSSMSGSYWNQDWQTLQTSIIPNLRIHDSTGIIDSQTLRTWHNIPSMYWIGGSEWDTRDECGTTQDHCRWVLLKAILL